jgi:Fe2+ transport system protein FeoA
MNSEYGYTPLSSTKTGQEVKLVTIKAGQCLKNRLSSMGLVPGVNFKVLRNDMCGQLILEVKNSKIAIGRGMADKVFIRNKADGNP